MKLCKKLFTCLAVAISLASCDVVWRTQVGSDLDVSRFYSYLESTRTEIIRLDNGLWDFRNNGQTLGQLAAKSDAPGVVSFEVVRTNDSRLWVGRKFDLVTYVHASPGYTCEKCKSSSPSERAYLPILWAAER
jgi:hypothetical protein